MALVSATLCGDYIGKLQMEIFSNLFLYLTSPQQMNSYAISSLSTENSEDTVKIDGSFESSIYY